MRRAQTLTAIFAVCALLQSEAQARLMGDLDFEDALGARVQGPGSHNQVWAFVFLSQESRDSSRHVMQAIDERYLNDPEIETVAVVDMRPYDNFLLRGIAKGRLKDQAIEGLERRRERRVARGVEATEAQLQRWHLVGDFKGDLHERFDVNESQARPVVFVLGRCAERIGPFEGSDKVNRIIDTISGEKGKRRGDCRKEAK